MELKLLSFACILAIIGLTRADDFRCKTPSDISEEYTKTLCYIDSCANKIKAQVAEELTAAFSYLLMASHFDQENINRPGLAKFLYEAGSEERQHAILMIDYLNMRGIDFDQSNFKKEFPIYKSLDYRRALEIALDMEIKVTNLIYNIVESCSTDFHGADEFTDPILEEQHEGIRKLQGLLKTYNDMVGKTSDTSEIALAEYLFDRKMEA